MALVRRIGLFSLVTLFAAIATPPLVAQPAGPDGSVELTAREREWLSEHPVIRFAPDPGYQPIESLDENGRLVGISADYLKLLENKLGIGFRIVPATSWDEAMSMARNREVDMLSAATKTVARSEYMSFTTPHIELPGVIIVRNSAPDVSGLDQLRGKKVGVVSSYVWQEWIARDHPDIDLRPVADMQTGLLLASFGQLDAMVGNLATATHFIQKMGVTNLRVTAESGYFARLAIATRRDWPELNTILQKAVSSISAEENRAILDKWIKLEARSRLDTQTILLGLLIIVAVAGLAATGNLAWNYSLRKMVRRQSVSLRDSEARFRAIVEDQTELIGRTLPGSHKLTFVNQAYAHCFGKRPDDLIGTSFMDMVPEAERAEIKARFATLSADHPVIHIEHSSITTDGDVRWHLWTNRAIFDDEGNIKEIQAVGRDTTEMKRAADAMRLSEEKFSRAFRAGPDSIAITRMSDGTIIDANDRFLSRMGCTFEDFVGRPTSEVVIWENPEDRASLMNAIAATGECTDLEADFRFADGNPVNCLVSARTIEVEGEMCALIITRDISDRKQAEIALRDNEQRFRDYAEASADSFWEMDSDLRFTYLSSNVERVLGIAPEWYYGKTREDLLGDDYDKEAWNEHMETLREHRPFQNFEYFRVGEGVDPAWLRVSGVPVFDEDDAFLGYRGTVSDITERKKVEDELRQAQKMEVVGQLTGGVAHDFNNLLMIISGNLELARESLDDNTEVADLVDRATVAAERGATLTHRLLAFSRKQTLTPGIVDLDELVASLKTLLRRTLTEIVEVETVNTDDLWPCEADSSQIESALLNLAINARDAMPDGGKLTIETANVTIDEYYATAESDVTPGHYVMVAVTDTGVGMTRHAIDHAFEPFFTTKEVGSGSGLGLSMIYGFVKQSGGHVTIYSEEGHGTTVKMYFPRSSGQPEEVLVDGHELEPQARGETILVVEDDADVRALTVALLGDLGYDVLEAADGGSALAMLDRTPRLDLLLTDVVLPGGMSGPRLADEFSHRAPTASVLFMSGYTDNAIVHQGRFDKGVELLNKPFPKAALARKVRSTLDKAES